MYAVDAMFLAAVLGNPQLRPRVGNPDEMRSNRMQQTLDALKFRVTAPEPDVPEDILGAVITALNEEAVASAALANKGGINIIVTYEAFGAKMHGVMRQEIIFAKHCQESGRPQSWLSIPLALTSHTWENGKNEQSHQDPVMAEAMMGEAADVSRVMFIPDYNTASAAMRGMYQSHGQFWTLVVPKAAAIADLFSQEEAERLLEQGVLRLDWASYKLDSQQVILTAVGAYQLEEVLKASARLAQRDVPHSVVYLLEPARFREPHSKGEREHTVPQELRAQIYPDSVSTRIFVIHTRPGPLLGALQTLNTGWNKTSALGYISQGGTLDVQGLLFINRCTWAHILLETARALAVHREDLLTAEELSALEGRAAPGLVLA